MKSASNLLIQSLLFLIAVTTPVIAFGHEESSPPCIPPRKYIRQLLYQTVSHSLGKTTRQPLNQSRGGQTRRLTGE